MADLQSRLNRAAIDLSAILSKNGTKHGIFGGWAVNALGSGRETKDVDCLAAIGKDDLIELMADKPGWTQIPNMREDYAPYFWDDELNKPVLVEVFPASLTSPANTENSIQAMKNIRTEKMDVDGTSVQILGTIQIFKGKLRAAAGRQNETDAQDLLHLCRFFRGTIQNSTNKFDLEDVGKTIQRHPELAEVFGDLYINVEHAAKLGPFDVGVTLGPAAFEVQKGIIG
ncbi:hypothetical protein FQN54_006089 [Arachnomyces sp. PD_36]|nr:hypothetical protein FQN54_006089 [Arachnomyces sp. PD_36]